MNLKTARVSTGQAANIVNYLQGKGENELVEILDGDPDDIEAIAESRAHGFGQKYAIRHVMFSPDQALSADQEKALVQAWWQEWGAGDREALLVKHTKPRSDGSRVPHYHLAVVESDAQGRVLDNRGMYSRNEKISRMAELKFGHSIQKGRHNRAVVHALRDQGHDGAAGKLEAAGITQSAPALARFSSKSHQIAKRQGIDLAAISHQLAHSDRKLLPETLADVSGQHGVRFRNSDRGHLVMQSESGTFIASMNRMLKIDRSQNDIILQQLKEVIEYGERRQTSKDAGDDQQKSGSDRTNYDRDSSGSRASTSSGTGSESLRRTDRGPSPDGRVSGSTSRTFSQLHKRVNKLHSGSEGSSSGISGLLNRASGQIAARRRAQHHIPGNSAVGASYPPSSPDPAPRLDDPDLMKKLGNSLAQALQQRDAIYKR